MLKNILKPDYLKTVKEELSAKELKNINQVLLVIPLVIH